MSHQHCKRLYEATFQLYWRRKTSSAPPYIISGTSGQMSRTTDVPYANWIIYRMNKITVTINKGK